MTSDKKQEFTRRISEANPTELSVVLYDMILCYLDDAEEALSAGNESEFRFALSRAKGCFGELLQGLHMEYEPAEALYWLYRFCIRVVTTSDLRRNAEGVTEARKIIEPLREAYGKVADQNPSGSVMANSQTVYAGLTYGRSDVNENLVGDVNRGFRV